MSYTETSDQTEKASQGQTLQLILTLRHKR
jgi:hypothetical protein